MNQEKKGSVFAVHLLTEQVTTEIFTAEVFRVALLISLHPCLKPLFVNQIDFESSAQTNWQIVTTDNTWSHQNTHRHVSQIWEYPWSFFINVG